MFYKIKNVTPLNDFKLLVEFENNEVKKYDITPLLNRWTDFNELIEVNGLFKQVKVDVGGYGISWNDDLDLSCNELYENGKTQTI